MSTAIQIVFDCADPDRIADFWALALDYIKQPPPPGHESWQAFLIEHGLGDRIGMASAIVDPGGVGPRIYFQRVPEPKTVKNRMHLDINAGSADVSPDERRRQVEERVARLTEAGASKVRVADEADEFWIVMQDPEGNEFCVQ